MVLNLERTIGWTFSKLKLHIKCNIRYIGTRIPKRIDVSRLKSPVICQDLQMTFEDIKFENT